MMMGRAKNDLHGHGHGHGATTDGSLLLRHSKNVGGKWSVGYPIWNDCWNEKMFFVVGFFAAKVRKERSERLEVENHDGKTLEKSIHLLYSHV